MVFSESVPVRFAKCQLQFAAVNEVGVPIEATPVGSVVQLAGEVKVPVVFK